MTPPRALGLALRPTADDAWTLEAQGYDLLREASRESRFAISNGLLGVRGARAFTRGERWVVPPRTYVAGLFDTPVAEDSIPVRVPAADWLKVRLWTPKGPVVHGPEEAPVHRTTLDMRRGVLLTDSGRLRGPDLGGRARTLRLVSLSERSIGMQLIQFEIDRGEIEITLEASFEGVNLGLVAERLEQDLGVWRTKNSGKALAMAAKSSLQIDGREALAVAGEPLTWSWTWMARPGQVVCFERLVAVVRSDVAGQDPGDAARDRLGHARLQGWTGVLAGHAKAWAERWRCSDVEVDGDEAAQRGLRFAGYHLNSAADPADETVSIGARALTGDDYAGHVFWDTEIFLAPFYILTWPQAARALLMYRFHTLDAARAKARRLGYRGALYAWESTDSGDEATPKHVLGPDRLVVPVLCGVQEQHVSADVAYAVWQYWQATADEGFLLDAGAEILIETGRFWADRAALEADGLHHIRGVIGPDEYHEGIDDNAFTNVMARWNIRRALEVAALLAEGWPNRWALLSASLKLTPSELDQWRAVAGTMATGLDAKTGLFEQFQGFFSLEQVDLAHYAGRSVPMDVVLGRKRVAQSQVVKQADVVALLALLPDEFLGDTGAKNFGYYEPRCSHGSSLSPALHGLAAARLGQIELALGYFRQTANIDLDDLHVASPGGVHIAALGGIWLMAVFGFAGLSLSDEALTIDPRMPAAWRCLAFSVQWRGRRLRIRIEQDHRRLEATLEAGEPMSLIVCGKPHSLRRGEPHRIRIPTRPSVPQKRRGRG